MSELENLRSEALEFEMQGKIRQAIDKLNEILQIGSVQYDLRVKLGELYYVSGKINKSIQEFEKVIEDQTMLKKVTKKHEQK